MYLSIIILPLLGSIVSGFFGRKVGVTGSRILGCLSIMITTILAIISFFEVGFNNNPVSINLFKWLDNESFNMAWNFQFDSLTVSMLIPVLIISSLVHFYSIGYMSHDPHNQRFFSYLSLFTFMMIILVTGNNYLVMFVGWEGVGVCSYLLVSFWFTRIAANQSSLSAFLTNRVGDAFLMIGMFILLWTLGTLDYSTVFSLAPYINENITTIIGICLLIGAMAKSSQVGLHIWLPMAMEGLLNGALLKLHYMREHPVLNSWSSVYLIDFGKIQAEGQSAGNFIKNEGSSETTCEAIKINEKFKWWFIGFTEGDGSFIVNKDGYLEFKITQSSVDAQILFYIKKELGFGSASVQDKINKTHHYRVRDRKNIHKLIQIFNGNIVTNYKLNQFKVWVHAFNKIYKTNIHCMEDKHELTLNNAWLSGFTDAEGCFTSSTSVSKSTGQTITTVRYVISQKDDIGFSKDLANKINGYITHVKSYNGYNTVVNFGKLNKILLYLSNYPLKTKKFISYKRWLKIYGLVKNKKHLTLEGRIIIKFLSKLIN
jgi:proton-conducting membrane transporter/NADH-ubiquinone oxidoreductase (complex I) subunit 5/LAGLIDADG DNA endonuclease family protein